MWLAEIADKTSLPQLLVIAVALTLGIVILDQGSWIGRIVSICLVTLWDLAIVVELSDRSFVDVARRELGSRYEITLVAGGAVPLAAAVLLTARAVMLQRRRSDEPRSSITRPSPPTTSE